MTDERDENSQKDEADTLLGFNISHSNRTKLLFHRHLNLNRSVGLFGFAFTTECGFSLFYICNAVIMDES